MKNSKDISIRVKDVSKQYRLGVFGTGMLSYDIKRWWFKIRRKEDPFKLVTDTNDRTKKSENQFVWALKDVNFEVQKSEVLGIIGRNGAGKSTLLKVLSQVTPPTTGKIQARGRIASLLEVGTGMHPELTGKENIYLNGSILGMSKDEITSKFDKIVDFSGCARYIDTPLKRYSSGMKVRLGFAVAAFLEPEILIVDEVLAVGDAEFQKKAIGKMKDVSRGEGRTVLFVSHNIGSIRALCDRAIVMENGTVAFVGPVEEAIQSYLAQGNTKQIDLKQREDRIGSGIFKFESISLINNLSQPSKEIISGEKMIIRVTYVCADLELLSKQIILGFNICDQYDQFVLSYVSDEMGFMMPELKSSGTIDLNIPRLLLRGGEYRIRLFSSYSGTGKNDLLDVIEGALSFTVIPSDFWGNGKITHAQPMAIAPGELSSH